jgi:DNA-binding protein YbaB
MNIQNLMAQARKIQGEVEKITKEIENSTFTEENEVVYIEMNGKNEIIKLSIKNNEVLKFNKLLANSSISFFSIVSIA